MKLEGTIRMGDQCLHISTETSALLESYSRSSGIDMDRLVEEAVALYVGAAKAGIPAEAVIPPVAVLTRESAEEFLSRLKSPQAPTPALRALMKRRVS